LDTTFCVVWLQEQGWEVATVAVDTGGFPPAELDRIEELSEQLGAVAHVTEDAREELFERYLRYLVAANALRGAAYPLSVSAERVCQVTRVVQQARALGAVAIAHGSTGAGNDQVRFDVGIRALAPDLELVTPIRDLGLSREAEAAYLADKGVSIPERIRDYSVNVGMWGATVGGRETLGPWGTPPEHTFPGGDLPEPGALPALELVIGWERGVPISVDGDALPPVELVARLNDLGARYGVGRGIHLGDTILGIKGRVGYEAPAAHLLIAAHRELEKLTLSGKQLFWKETLGNLYGALLHEGHFFDPLCRDLEAFMDSSQATVCGDVRLRLARGMFRVQGVRSPYSMMDPEVAAYGEANRSWDARDAAGFTRIFGLQQTLALNARRRGDDASKARGQA